MNSTNTIVATTLIGAFIFRHHFESINFQYVVLGMGYSTTMYMYDRTGA
ncbi:hypothetical protein PR003_g33161 [Phytophthora rubi]|uniref:Uncharacterized protein n=1 Tax=Phytophthora rubi TaxID=129364 RepID=A0A6A4AVF8_9STRA|nr:hypothetical protein PR003_g33161 [Phytophthora rubi]